MEYRKLGSDLHVPVLSFGTATFGEGPVFKAWGSNGVKEAIRIVDLCLEAGVTMFDSADVYSAGQAEKILGHAIKGRRNKVLISTKGTFRMSDDRDDVGSGRAAHLTKSIEDSLRRLGTDYIDLYQLHGFDALTPVEEALGTLNDFVRAGKIRSIGCSNFSGWHLMKSLAASERHGWARYVAHQAYYSLLGREFEWELMPLALDQGVGHGGVEPTGDGPAGWENPARPGGADRQPAQGRHHRADRTAGCRSPTYTTIKTWMAKRAGRWEDDHRSIPDRLELPAGSDGDDDSGRGTGRNGPRDVDDVRDQVRRLWLAAHDWTPLVTPLEQLDDPFRAGIHRAITVPGGERLPALPPYLERDHDHELRGRSAGRSAKGAARWWCWSVARRPARPGRAGKPSHASPGRYPGGAHRQGAGRVAAMASDRPDPTRRRPGCAGGGGPRTVVWLNETAVLPAHRGQRRR